MLDEDSLSPSEILAVLHPEEVYAASIETSAFFNCIVLCRAIKIVLRKKGFNHVSQLVPFCNVAKTTLYRYAKGERPINNNLFNRAMTQLVLILSK